jgi:hypothetical protein
MRLAGSLPFCIKFLEGTAQSVDNLEWLVPSLLVGETDSNLHQKHLIGNVINPMSQCYM